MEIGSRYLVMRSCLRPWTSLTAPSSVFRYEVRLTNLSQSLVSRDQRFHVHDLRVDTSSSACTNAPLESSARQDKPATSTGSREGLLHVGVVCDGCGGSIYGTRYKCHVCRDYDLCTACKDRGYHNEHSMAALESPSGYHCPQAGYSCASSGYPWPPAGPGMTTGHGASCTANTNPPSSSDQQKGFFHSIGKAVASVLEPLGISVDVVDERKPSSEGAAPKEAYSASDIDVRRCSCVSVCVCGGGGGGGGGVGVH